MCTPSQGNPNAIQLNQPGDLGRFGQAMMQRMIAKQRGGTAQGVVGASPSFVQQRRAAA